MQDGATVKKIRLGEVATALAVAPKLIRNWVASEDFDLIAQPDRAENKWREYSYLDVAHLAIAAQIIRYGFTIGEAHDFAGATLVRVLEPLMTDGGQIDTAHGGMIEAFCRGMNLYLFKLTGGDTVSILSPPDDLPRYHAALHIDLEMCVGMAFAGLAEIGHDAHSSSRAKEYTEEEAEELRQSWRAWMTKHWPEGLPKTTEAPAGEQVD